MLGDTKYRFQKELQREPEAAAADMCCTDMLKVSSNFPSRVKGIKMHF